MEMNLASLDIYHVFYLMDLEKNAHISRATAWVFYFSRPKLMLNEETYGTAAWGALHVSVLIPLLHKHC